MNIYRIRRGGREEVLLLDRDDTREYVEEEDGGKNSSRSHDFTLEQLRSFVSFVRFSLSYSASPSPTINTRKNERVADVSKTRSDMIFYGNDKG